MPELLNVAAYLMSKVFQFFLSKKKAAVATLFHVIFILLS